ncbi:unnamed protein product [Amoebophrya sp. A25]|nr:unnamed protein product [Amoebophrya sp. A25]|eukprot:GSA25T00014899001.1
MSSFVRQALYFGGALLLAPLSASALSACEKQPYKVEFSLENEGGATHSVIVAVTPEWSPEGSKRFRKLVSDGFYDDTRFFRVIRNFMAQFGLNGDPKKNSEYPNIQDDPVRSDISNLPGRITFAKTGAPNSRTTQLFINYANNANLDPMGFTPFGEIEGDSGAKAKELEKFIFNIGERPNQGAIREQGNSYLDKDFPKLTKIKSVKIIEGAACGGEQDDL